MSKEERLQEFNEIPKVNFSNCFGCSPSNSHGLKLRFWLSDKGCIKSRCVIPSHFCGFDGLAHGGIIATLLDEIAAWTNFVHLQRIGVTLEASIHYFKPVPTDTEILIEGNLIQNDEKKSIINSTIHSSEGTLLAEAKSTWLLPSSSTIAKMTGVDESEIQKMIEKMTKPISDFLAKVEKG